MSKDKQISIRITNEQYNALNRYGNPSKGIEALVSLTDAINDWALTSIRKQKLTKEEIMVLADPLSMRVSQSLDDKTIKHLCDKHKASPEALSNKLSALHAIEMIFLAEEFKHHKIDELRKRFGVS